MLIPLIGAEITVVLVITEIPVGVDCLGVEQKLLLAGSGIQVPPVVTLTTLPLCENDIPAGASAVSQAGMLLLPPVSMIPAQ